MNLGLLMKITKDRVDETDIDEQIDSIIKSAINHCYKYDLAKLSPVTESSYIPIINGVLELPDNALLVKDTIPSIDYKKIGNKLYTKSNGVCEVIYTIALEDLINDEDEPLVREEYHYIMSTYACYQYFAHRKKTSVAQLFLQEYQMAKQEIKSMIALEELENQDGIGGVSYIKYEQEV